MKLSRIRSRVNVSPDLSGVNEPEGLALDCSVKRNNFLEIWQARKETEFFSEKPKPEGRYPMVYTEIAESSDIWLAGKDFQKTAWTKGEAEINLNLRASSSRVYMESLNRKNKN